MPMTPEDMDRALEWWSKAVHQPTPGAKVIVCGPYLVGPKQVDEFVKKSSFETLTNLFSRPIVEAHTGEHEMTTDRATELLENARRQFATNGAPWNDRTEAAVKSLISGHILGELYLTIPPKAAQALRHGLLNNAVVNCRKLAPDEVEALAWLDERYDTDKGERIED